MTALDWVTGALVPFDDTARVIGARTFASHFIQAVAMLGVLIVEALHEQTGVEIRTAVARIMYSAGVEHLRTAQSVQLRHAFESQHINNDTRHHVGDRRTALYINNRFTFDDFMNTFSAGRIRVRRLHATGGSAVAPSDDRFSSCGGLFGDLQGTLAAYATISLVLGR